LISGVRSGGNFKASLARPEPLGTTLPFDDFTYEYIFDPPNHNSRYISAPVSGFKCNTKPAVLNGASTPAGVPFIDFDTAVCCHDIAKACSVAGSNFNDVFVALLIFVITCFTAVTGNIPFCIRANLKSSIACEDRLAF
jgi:hypothetical protein